MRWRRRGADGVVDALSMDGDVVAVIPPPSKALWAAELPRALWMGATWWRHRATARRRAEGTDERSWCCPAWSIPTATILLRRYLTAKGYRPRLGTGAQPGYPQRRAGCRRLIARVETLASQGSVTLIGISLGGIMARMVAQARPDIVAGVITVASPYAGRRARPMSGGRSSG